MAKAIGISSQFRGKIGNVIGYLAKNRAGRNEQIVKSYQPVVANPQSYAQALARVPVGPVQRVCSALLPIIQRGFEGVAYGEASKTEFLSYNLKFFRGPFMPKGTVMVPPGAMLISKGSLRPITFSKWVYDGEYNTVSTNLRGIDKTELNTYGQISSMLLGRNDWLKVGEQLTLVVVTLDHDEYTYHYQSLFLDTSNTKSRDYLWNGIWVNNNIVTFNDEDMALGVPIVAISIVRSQPYGDSSFKRSTAFLNLNPNVYQYNDDAAVQSAVASYRTGEDPEDWEDDPTPEYQQLAYLCMVNITKDMVITDSWTYAQGSQCLGYVTKGGEIGVFYTYSVGAKANCLCDAKGNALTKTDSGVIKYIRFNSSYQPSREYSSIYGTL